MDKFIVSARKYRPQNFSTVIGQSHITTTLKNAINNDQLAHAFLFCGPRGVGKTTCARILAKTINCENRTPEGEACDTCNSCVSFNNGTSLNIHELDAASNNSVDDIRALTEQVRFAPQAGKYKVYIVDEVHMLSQAAFNAFLKTLEEPPPYAIFILATTEKHKILPTILSRCQIFDFKRITINDTVDHLRSIVKNEKIEAEKAALHIIAQKSEGCLRDALSILDKIVSFTDGHLKYSNTLEHLNILDEDYYFKLIDFMQKQELPESMLLFDEIMQRGFEGDTFLDGFSEFLRNILISKDKKSVNLLEVAEDFKEKYKKYAREISLGWLLGAMNIISETIINYKLARNKKLHIEMTLIKLTYLSQAVELIEGNELSKKKLTDSKVIAFKTLNYIPVKEFDVKPFIKPEIKSAKLVVQEPKLDIKQKPEPAVLNEVVLTEKPIKKKLSSLNKIREQISEESRLNTIIELNNENINLAWKEFIEKLENDKKHSTVTNFKNAEAYFAEENKIEIKVNSAFHQKYIESERSNLIEHLQKFFNNNFLNYQFLMEEIVEENKERPLTKKEQLQVLMEQYPLIQKLKEDLNLEMDF